MNIKEQKITQAVEIIEKSGYSASVIENIIFICNDNKPLAWMMTNFRGKELKLLVNQAVLRAISLENQLPKCWQFIDFIQEIKNNEYRKRYDLERPIENDVLNQAVSFPCSYGVAIDHVMNGQGYTIGGKKLRFIRNAKKRKFVFRNIINALCDRFGVN